MRPLGPAGSFPPMNHQHIQAEQRDGVLKLTLDRPDVLNSFNARMAEELVRALRGAATDSGKLGELRDEFFNGRTEHGRSVLVPHASTGRPYGRDEACSPSSRPLRSKIA